MFWCIGFIPNHSGATASTCADFILKAPAPQTPARINPDGTWRLWPPWPIWHAHKIEPKKAYCIILPCLVKVNQHIGLDLYIWPAGLMKNILHPQKNMMLPLGLKWQPRVRKSVAVTLELSQVSLGYVEGHFVEIIQRIIDISPLLSGKVPEHVLGMAGKSCQRVVVKSYWWVRSCLHMPFWSRSLGLDFTDDLIPFWKH